jgi:hypothetical protein
VIPVCCVWVRGNVDYPIEYVLRLRSMVARHLTAAHTFIVFTDRPSALPEDLRVHAVPIGLPADVPGWWAKLRLFDRSVRNTQGADPFHCRRMALYLDLDSVIVDALDPLIDLFMALPGPMLACPPGGTFPGRNGRRCVRRLNSSVMVFDPHAAAIRALWESFKWPIVDLLWGDQDWIGLNLDDVKAIPGLWVPRISECLGAVDAPPAGARVVLCKKPKNAAAATRYRWVREAWA